MSILIYKAEAEIKDLLDNNSIAFCSKVYPLVGITEEDKLQITSANPELQRLEADEQFDLYPLNTILVSTGWNKNDDIFDRLDTWAARKTPINKPLNVGHDQSKIRGHITASVGINEKNEILPDDSTIDSLPELYHILTSAFLYKIWKPTEIQKEMDSIIAEIALGEWFVSMECLFKGFDYGIVDLDGTQKTIARDVNTAFLTKHLRVYGGSGVYDGRKIGRVLRNITFSGKGLVRNPANPYSIIVTDKFVGTKASLENIGVIMADKEVDLKELTAKIDKLVENKTEAGVKELVAQFEAKVADKDALAEKLVKVEALNKEVSDKLMESEAKTIELTAKLDEASKSLVAVNSTLAKIQTEAKLVSRTSAIVAKGKTAEEAAAFVTKFENLDDVTFAEVVSLIEIKTKEKVEKTEAEIEKVKKTELETEVVEATLSVAEKTENASAKVVEDIKNYFTSKTENKESK